MKRPFSPSWVLALVVLFVLLGALTAGLFRSAPFGASAAPTPQVGTSAFTLRLHTNLTTGVTSCPLEAGNLFDLQGFGLEPPVLVQQVRFYAQSFQGAPASPAIVRLYAAQSSSSTVGTSLLATSGPIQVSGNSPTAYTVTFGNVLVNAPYLLATVEIGPASVLRASPSGQGEGRSFVTSCGQGLGAARMQGTVMDAQTRLGIEVLGSRVSAPTEVVSLTKAQAPIAVTLSVTSSLTAAHVASPVPQTASAAHPVQNAPPPTLQATALTTQIVQPKAAASSTLTSTATAISVRPSTALPTVEAGLAVTASATALK